ncbi:penicillin-binding transpeptidase domain-containing protein [Clostridium sp. 19966]|uniref:penicillin-binding transpeptidase domain-containing protein n=1 Tax=Clostridium sp. 19966 TaxID=2768166 RepID=UPI0028DE4462|nr:penicillin-binding transpeptidase domain-containing protein [Clostridium sp. 19966]MDT8719493.1 penicillin-binding transpeptidase domain-containing protein [Clostridium sp. 19966]
MKGKKLFIAGGVLAVIAVGLAVVVLSSRPKVKPAETFKAYQKVWEKQDFKGMYNLLSADAKKKISQDDFVKRYQNIYNGIEAANIKVKYGNIDDIKGENNQADIPFSVNMDTLAGSVQVSKYDMKLKEEKVNDKETWTVDWNQKLIFPNLGDNDKVKVNVTSAKRGQILDRNGKALATNGTLNSIIIIPSKFNTVKDKAVPEIAQILGISQDTINSKLKNAGSSSNYIPLVTLSADDKDKATKLTAIDGVQYMKVQGRIYPGGEAFGSLIGYTGAITAEELKAHTGEGYTAQDKIGKAGLEQVYEKRLRGQKGGEIYIAKDGKTDDASKEVIAKKDAKDGEDITIAVDFDTQQKIYSEMKNDAGASAAINPKTGEILALVSSPSYDSNLFSTYIPDSVSTAWKNAGDKDPFNNRFKAVYSPGSTFKLVTGAIGLKTGAIKADDKIDIKGTSWQKDKSWGSHVVTTLEDPGRPMNLQDAYVYSHNIYFAMAALNIGKDKFESEAKNFGIGEKLPIDYPIAQSQLSNKGLTSDELIADTGYGQGEVLLSPINLALIYSSLANNGDMMTPVLELKGQVTPKVWKEKAIDPTYVKTLTDDLTQVVENPAGTAYTNPAGRVKILGKTGTPELKQNQNDKNAEENGWFVAMNTDNPSFAIAMMIQNVKNRGESHYVVPIVKRIIDDRVK